MSSTLDADHFHGRALAAVPVQFGMASRPVLVTGWHSAPFVSISVVVLLGAYVEMGGLKAVPYVTVVQDIETFGDWTDGKNEGQPMGAGMRMAVKGKFPVATFTFSRTTLFDATSPQQTRSRTLATRPEFGNSSSSTDRHGAQFEFTRPGYKGIWDNLSREDFNRLGGFSVVWLT